MHHGITVKKNTTTGQTVFVILPLEVGFSSLRWSNPNSSSLTELDYSVAEWNA